VQLIELHHAFPQLQVAVEGRQVLVHAVDEPRVDRRRNVRAVELRREVRGILSRLREELDLQHFAAQRRTERAAERTESGEERRHHFLAIGAVRQRAQLAECGLIELDVLSRAQRHRGKREVGVGEDVVQTRRIAGERAGVGEQFFLGVAQRVRGAAEDVRQVEAVDLQARL
jgi:hypothetical protein